MFLKSLTVILTKDDTVRGVIADYAEVIDEREMPVGTKRLPARDIERHLPASATMLSQIDAMAAQVSALTTERDAMAAQVKEPKA